MTNKLFTSLAIATMLASTNIVVASERTVINDGETINIQNQKYENLNESGEIFGGAIKNQGTLNVKDSTFNNNTGYSGGAIFNSSTGTLNITNSTFTNNTATKSDGDGGAVVNSGTINTLNGIFTNNSAYYNGGAIANTVNISTINAEFKNNSAQNGGAIYNYYDATIGDINGEFTTNSSNFGGAVYNLGTIDKVNANFSNNSATQGGAIYNSKGTIKSIQGDFINNSSSSTEGSTLGGAIYNTGNIGTIIGNFIGNYTSSTSTSDAEHRGGAIYNGGNQSTITGTIGEIINSSFYNNYMSTALSTHPYGGAIYTTNDLTITANGDLSINDGITIFKGNYTKTQFDTIDNAIFMAKGINSHQLITLKLNSINNGKIYMYDKIDGFNYYGHSAYTVNITGDNTGYLYLFNDIVDGHVTTDNTTISTINSEIYNYEFFTLTSEDTANYEIDVDLQNATPQSDTFTIERTSNGKITISNINHIGAMKDYKVQILKAQDDNIQLDLTDDLKNKYNGTTTETLLTSDEMKADVNWKDTFKTYKQEKTTTSTLALDTINTTNDSITFSQTTSLGQVVESGTAGDTLALLNQYETTDTRNFNFDNATDVYTVQSDLGTTSSGTININGVSTETGRSTINGNSKILFQLDNETDLNLNNVKIQNAASVVTGSNKDAEIVLNNVDLKDNSSGIRTAGSVTIKGDSTLTNNGNGIEVTSTTSEITVDATDSEITLGDTLTGVRGARLNLNNGRVKVQKKISALDVMMNNAEVDMASDTLFNGQNITVNTESSLNMINNATSIMSVNTLTLKDALNLAVDVDLANQSMDRIIASNYDLG